MYIPQLLTSLGLLTGGAGALILALEQSVQASGAEVHPTPLPWWHKDFTHTYDHARFVYEQRNCSQWSMDLTLFFISEFQSASRLRSLQECLRCMPFDALYRLPSFSWCNAHRRRSQGRSC